MKTRLLVAVPAMFVTLTLVSACGNDTNPTRPTRCEAVSVQPQIIHMRVGQKQEFSAFGGSGSGIFAFSFERPDFVNLEQIAPGNKVVLTVVRSYSGESLFVLHALSQPTSSSCNERGQALVYIAP